MSETKTVWHNFPNEKTDKEKILNRNLIFPLPCNLYKNNEDTTICSANNAHYTTK